MDNILEPRQLWQIIQKYFFLLMLMAIIGAGVGYGEAKNKIKPTYSASTSMLVNRSVNYTDNATATLPEQQQADVLMISTYESFINSSNVLGTVSDELAHPVQKEVTKYSNKNTYELSVDELKSMVSISSQPNSQVFSINVKSPNAQLAVDVANKVAAVFKEKIGSFIQVKKVSIIDSAKAKQLQGSTSIKSYIAKGIAIFGGLTFLLVLIKEFADTTIKSPDEVSQATGLINIGVVGHIKPVKNLSARVSVKNSAQRSKIDRLE